MLSDFEPPSDPEAIPVWLLAQEEEIAELVVARLTGIIDRTLTAFTATLTAAGDPSVFDAIPVEWSRFVREELSDRLGGMYLSGGISAWIQSPGTEALSEATAEGWTDVVNTSAVSYASDATNRLTGQVSDSIWNDLKLKVSKAIETGASTERLSQEIAMMGEFATFRAQTIARTEVNGAYNAGNYQSNQALGDMGPVEKYWISTGDDRTRETHREAGGQVRAFADPFLIGGSEMLYPHDPAGPAREVVNCRCVVGYLYPGMTRPDGTIVPESPVGLARAEGSEPLASTPVVTEIPTREFGRGPAATQTFSDLVEVPTAQRGRLVERSAVMREITAELDNLHGLPSTSKQIDVVLGGKAAAKGGHFTPATKGPRPKRTRGMSVAEWNEKAREYNARPLRAEIRINDVDLDKQAHFLTHELGHASDWDGTVFRSRSAWGAPEIRSLQAKRGKDWLEYLDEIPDEETRLFATLGKKVREAESVKGYLSQRGVTHEFRQYFTSVEEVWARSYAQWAAEATENPRLVSALKAQQEAGYQFSDEEFAEIRPIIERILRLRGLMK